MWCSTVRALFLLSGPDGFDPEDVAERVEELAEWLGRMKTQYGIDPARLLCAGLFQRREYGGCD